MVKLFYGTYKVKTRSFTGVESTNSETNVFEDSFMWDIGITILYYKNGVGGKID